MFEWDDRKAANNLAKHGVPFEYAVRVFDDPHCLESDVSRMRDEEARRKTVGRIGGKLFAVVFTMRGNIRRIISARRTNTKEERRHANRAQDQS
jgi:uncharacterized DUF497 family protein